MTLEQSPLLSALHRFVSSAPITVTSTPSEPSRVRCSMPPSTRHASRNAFVPAGFVRDLPVSRTRGEARQVGHVERRGIRRRNRGELEVDREAAVSGGVVDSSRELPAISAAAPSLELEPHGRTVCVDERRSHHEKTRVRDPGLIPLFGTSVLHEVVMRVVRGAGARSWRPAMTSPSASAAG